MAQPRGIVGPVWIDVRKGRRFAFDRMMIQNDNVETGLPRRHERIRRPCPAVHGADKPGAFVFQLQQGARRGAVTLRHSIGDIDAWRCRDGGQEFIQQCRRARAVHVIVAEDRNTLAALDGGQDPRDGFVHVLERQGFGKKTFKGWIKIIRCGARRDAPRQQQSRQHQ